MKKKIEPVCSWPMHNGESFVQALTPETAKKVKRWRTARLVAGSIAGGFVRVYGVLGSEDAIERRVRRLNATA